VLTSVGLSSINHHDLGNTNLHAMRPYAQRGATSARFNTPRTENAATKHASLDERDPDLLLRTLREIPKSRYATQLAVTQMPAGRGKKAVFSHVEIFKMVEDIATSLRESGVRPGTVCAMILPNCVEAVVYFLALQWIGAIAAPIDPQLELEVMKTLLKDVKAFTAVSLMPDDNANSELDTKVAAATTALGIIHWNVFRSMNKGVQLEQHGRRAGEGAAWKGGSGDFKIDPSEISAHLVSDPNDVTKSGLVVPLSHENLALSAMSYAKAYNLGPDQNVNLLTAPLYSIHGLLTMICSLHSGGHTVIQAPGKSMSGSDILALGKENKVTWVSCSAELIGDIFEEVKKSPKDKFPLRFLRCHHGRLENIAAIKSGLSTEVYTSYGTPECSGLATTNNIEHSRDGTFGQPVPPASVKIFHPETKELCGQGVVGEVGVAGALVSRGYLNSDRANLDSLIVTSSQDEKRTTYFLVGDRGSLDADGYLIVAGDSKQVREAERLEKERALALLQEHERLELLRIETEMAERARTEREEAERLEREKSERLAREEKEKRLKQEEEEKLRIQAEAEKQRLQEAEALLAQENEHKRIQEEQKRADEEERLRKQLEEATKTTDKRSQELLAGMMHSTGGDMDTESVNKILERLQQIEVNQKRMEDDLKAKHAAEMLEMQRLLDETQAASKRAVEAQNTTINVNMDEINSAVNAASLAAQESSRNTAEAALAAKSAALAAEQAAAKRGIPDVDPNASKVEISDPNNVQKTVVVALDDIEEAMLLHPAVGVCRAFGRPDPRYGNEVFCAILPKKGARVSEPWLKLHAQSVLPAAWVPKKFFFRADLTQDMERKDLSTDAELKRISHLAGYSTTKMVKSPEWSPEKSKKAAG
jgi:acyl-CoA synthetase (AMP-forming)/AMP-acid ligase II